MAENTLDSGIRRNLKTLADIKLFEHMVIFVTAFLVSAVALLLLRIPFYWAVIPALATLAILHLWKLGSYKPLEVVESGNPALKERLRTAYDNKANDNFIVRELVREVGYELNGVRTESFLDIRNTKRCVGISIAAFILLLLLLMSGFEGFDLAGLAGPYLNNGSAGGGGSGSGQGGGSGMSEGSEQELPAGEASAGSGSPNDIYGAPSIAKIEGKELDLEIHPAYGEGGVLENNGVQPEVPATSSPFPVEATAAQSYSENIPLELENVVREYFKKTEEG